AAERSAGDVLRALPPPLQPGRAPPVLERGARRHEPGGAAPADPRGGGEIPALAAPPAGHEARHDLPLAGERAQQPRLRPLDATRPRIHRLLVADARLQDPAEDDSGRAVGQGGVVGSIRPPCFAELSDGTTPSAPKRRSFS